MRISNCALRGSNWSLTVQNLESRIAALEARIQAQPTCAIVFIDAAGVKCDVHGRPLAAGLLPPDDDADDGRVFTIAEMPFNGHE